MYTYEIDSDRAVITFQGDLDNRMIREAYEEVLNDPAFQSGFQILADDRATTFDPSMEEAQELVEFFASLADSVPQLAVVVRKEVHFGIGRMVEVFCENRGITLRIFRAIDEARAWLDAARGSPAIPSG